MQDDAIAALEPAIETPEADIAILAEVAESFTYASFQNAIPVLRSLALECRAGAALERLTLDLESTPPFLRPKRWTIDRLLPGDSLVIADRRIALDAAYLAGLDEAERGEIRLVLSGEGGAIAEVRQPVRLLARDEWGGAADMAQLLPAFVMPNDPAVARLLKAAADILAAHGHNSALDGYQSGSPARAFMLAAAIYSAVAGLGLHYAEPPASFERRGQKVRRPSAITADGLATCLDTSLLFAAALEGLGLNPVVLLFDGHAAAGVWLTKRSLASAIEPDAMELRKAIRSGELLVFETTTVTQRPAATLEMARASAEARLTEAKAHEFVAAIDIARSRSGGITPLASHSARDPVEGAGEGDVQPLPLPPLPGEGVQPREEVEVKPTTAAARIDRWQKKLLDLTLRNRLLNFVDGKKTIPFLCPDISYLEDRLAEGASIRLISLPEQNPIGGRDEALFRDAHGRELQAGFAADALKRDELASTLDAKQLETRLIELYRQVRNDFAEGGANTLFLAVGFLNWKQKPEDARVYRAPLLLLPVKLERRSATARFTLKFHEDEPRFNQTLLQMLERDFELPLPLFAGPLPTDDKGIDVPRLLAEMRQAVRDVPGMEVVDDTALSTFSFAKFLMWKDLVERTDALRQNRIVRHLVESPDQPFETADASFVAEDELDRRYDPADIVSLLPADSSQLAASLAAAEGRDFVIIGPPGTGKSQTIANMIANCLARGRTVLFVAEKTAALDVVHRRLRQHGLGDQCIELHSSKTDRRAFLARLRQSWEKGAEHVPADWVAANRRLKLRRDELNAYVAALHRRHGNGLSAYAALGLAMRGRDAYARVLAFAGRDAHDAEGRADMEAVADELGRVHAAVERQEALALVDRDDWSAAWQERLLGEAAALATATIALRTALDRFAERIGLPETDDLPLDELGRLSRFAEALRAAADGPYGFVFARDFGRLQPALDDLAGAVASYGDAETGMAARFDEATVRRMDIAGLDRARREADATFFPMSLIARRRLKRLLQSEAASGEVAPERDIAALMRMRQALERIDASPLRDRDLGFDGLDTDIEAAAAKLARGGALREALLGLDCAVHHATAMAQAIAPVLRGDPESEAIRRAGGEYRAALLAFLKAAQRFAAEAGIEPVDPASATPLGDLSARLATLAATRGALRDWSSWCRIRRRAVALGLSPVVADVEAGRVPSAESGAAFRLAYARWWLPLALDADPALREFRRFQHEHAITDFREIDDLVQAATAGYVASRIAHGLPAVQSVPRQSELGLLRHQMELQRPSRSIRDMIGAMPKSFARLAPCMLMSPLSIAQYLPADHALFDVVIFDEASQITTWDAVGAIARGRQTIIVGDPRQLPPTNFFGRNEDDEAVAEHERDLESILDEAKAAGIPVRDLRWHYRSRHESLIAFSNWHYYQNRLVTFPSPTVEDRAVRLHKVPDGVYDRGKSRTNRIEAEAVAQAAVERMRASLKLAEASRPTLAVITFNAQQQALIQDLLDEARRAEPALEWYFVDERVEPTIVKNLENVQGDERDVILFSITFTRDAAGKRSMDFGALNRDGGERRLNVAVTRARQELVVFSGFTADLIDTARTKAVAIQHLKTFLDYAERGAVALAAVDRGSEGGTESPFEAAVAAALEARGWTLVTQVGISGFRIDIGVRHPDRPGAFLAGIECDGATYHRSATARDRDKVREAVLRGLGWTILRVWSTDWWFEQDRAIDRLHRALEECLAASREAESAPDEPKPDETAPDEPMPEGGSGPDDDAALLPDAPGDTMADGQTPDLGAGAVDDATGDDEFMQDDKSERFASSPSGGGGAGAADDGVPRYRITDLSAMAADPDGFHEFSYRTTLAAMVQAVIDCEAPIREDLLAQRIARAHGWQRTGGKIRERIGLHLRTVERTAESSGTFIWKPRGVVEILPFREPANAEARRNIPEVPLAELAALVVANPDILDEPDPALALARLIGVERLAAASRLRLDEAFDRAASHMG